MLTICYICRKEWEPTKLEVTIHHKLFGVHYDFCGCCQKDMMDSFRKQFRLTKFLPKLRLEEDEGGD